MVSYRKFEARYPSIETQRLWTLNSEERILRQELNAEGAHGSSQPDPWRAVGRLGMEKASDGEDDHRQQQQL